MKTLKLLSLTLLVIFSLFLTNIHAAIKAVQISYINCKNLKDFENELIKIKSNGYNTVIFRVFNNPGDRIYPFILKKIKNKKGVYFNTSYCPVVFNLLPEVVKLCHKHNLKIIAWLTTRYLDFGNINQNRKVYKFDFDKNKIVPSKGLSFFNEKNIDFIINVYKDLLKNNIDGVLFQDDLKILADEDFNNIALRKYYKETGIKLTPKNIKSFLYSNASKRYYISINKNLTNWNNFKSKQIQYFLKKLISSCNKVKKTEYFMNINYETLNRPELSKLWYSYNLETLEKTPVNFYTVMLYQKQISKELHLNTNETFKYITKLVNNYLKFPDKSKVIFKIQVFDWYKNKPINRNNIDKIFNIFAKNNIKNIAIFPYIKGLTIIK